jgi:predicted amidohydrolase/ribosomal protein S18 acetylase RimI-like enzyme
MNKLDLSTFEKRILVRTLQLDDYDSLIELQRQCFVDMQTWSRDQIESQLRMFPEGQICIEYDGKLVGSSSSLIVNSADFAQWQDWKQVSDSGLIRNHDPEGDVLYGIEIMVHPSYRGMRLARRLYDARKKLARDLNLAKIIIGGRIPGYGDVADQMSAREYVERVMDKALFDPVLTAQVANGFVLKRLIPDYFPSDAQSRGYATYLEWANLDYVDHSKRQQARAVSLVRVGVVQYQMRAIQSFQEFEKQCEFFVDVGGDYKTDFLVFPELFTTQLLSLVHAGRPGLAARALADFTPQYLSLFCKLAVKYNVNIIGGTQFTIEHDKLYNIAYLFLRDGSLHKQYKIHPTPNERRWWGVSGGSKLEVFQTDRGRVAILICYDVEFPELCRIAAQKGAQILFVPFNTDNRAGYLRVRYCAQARCIENHVFTVTSGCVGNLPFVENADIHYAQSGVFSPCDLGFARDGVAAEATLNLESVVVHDLDTQLLRRHKINGTVQNWNDRRTDLYQIRYDDGGEGVSF